MGCKNSLHLHLGVSLVQAIILEEEERAVVFSSIV